MLERAGVELAPSPNMPQQAADIVLNSIEYCTTITILSDGRRRILAVSGGGL
jgi:hypothetical protein